MLKSPANLQVNLLFSTFRGRNFAVDLLYTSIHRLKVK